MNDYDVERVIRRFLSWSGILLLCNSVSWAISSCCMWLCLNHNDRQQRTGIGNCSLLSMVLIRNHQYHSTLSPNARHHSLFPTQLKQFVPNVHRTLLIISAVNPSFLDLLCPSTPPRSTPLPASLRLHRGVRCYSTSSVLTLLYPLYQVVQHSGSPQSGPSTTSYSALLLPSYPSLSIHHALCPACPPPSASSSWL